MTEGGVTSWSSASTSWERAAARWTVTFTWGEDFHFISCSARMLLLSKILKKAQKGQSLLPEEQIMTLFLLCCCYQQVSKKLCLLLFSCVTWFPCSALFLQSPCTTSCTEKEWSQHCREKPKIQYYKFSDLNEIGENTLISNFFPGPLPLQVWK